MWAPTKLPLETWKVSKQHYVHLGMMAKGIGAEGAFSSVLPLKGNGKGRKTSRKSGLILQINSLLQSWRRQQGFYNHGWGDMEKKDLIISSAGLKRARPPSMHTIKEVPTGQHHRESSHTIFLEISMAGSFSEVL